MQFYTQTQEQWQYQDAWQYQDYDIVTVSEPSAVALLAVALVLGGILIWMKGRK